MLLRYWLLVLLLLCPALAWAQPGPQGGGGFTPGTSVSAGTVQATGGTTSQTVANWAANSINVAFYGAVCDGVTDDYAHINAAISAASSSNVKAIYFPASATACLLSQQITIPTGVTLWAYPGSAMLEPTTGNTTNPVLIEMGTNTLVYGLILNGRSSTTFGTQNNLVQAYQVSNAVLDHVTIEHSRGVGALFSTSIVNSGVRDSIFNDIGNYWTTLSSPTLTTSASTSAGSAVLSFASTSGVVVGHTVLGTDIPANTTVVSIVPNTSVTLSQNVLSGGVANGASIQFIVGSNFSAQAIAFCCGTTSASTDNFVRDSYFTNIGLDAISFSANTRPYVSGNHLPLALSGWYPAQNLGANGVAAIYINTSNDIFIINNDLSGATGSGIDLYNNTGTVVMTNNRSRNNADAGGQISAQTGCALSGNVFADNNQIGALPVPYGSTFNSGLSLGGVSNAALSCMISSNSFIDDQATPTQVYGIAETSLPANSNIVIDSSNLFSGNITAPLSSGLQFNQPISDNRIINPCFAIDSQKEGGSYTGAGGLTNIMDGWSLVESYNAFSYARTAATSFPGCGSNALLVTLVNTSAGVSSQIYNFEQNIEGGDVQDLNYGTVNAQTVILDFCAKSSVAGTYTVALKNLGTSKTFLQPFTLAANTLACPSFAIPGDTATAVAAGSTYQMVLSFDLGSGSNWQSATTGSWISGAYYTTPSATSFSSQANGSTMQVSAVRLFKAAADGAWQPRTTAQELALTTRRYRKTLPIGTAVAQNAGVAGAVCTKNPIASGDPSMLWQWGQPMRASPTITTYNPSAANANWRDVTGSADVTVSVDPATALSGSGTGVLIATSGTVSTLGDVLCIQATADAR